MIQLIKTCIISLFHIIMKKLNNIIFPFNTIACAIVIPAIIFIVFVLKWLPCPICLLQQLCIFTSLVLSIFCSMGRTPQPLRNITHIVIIIIIIFGAYVAADQVYLQYFSSPAPTSARLDGPTCSEVTNPFLLKTTKAITGTIKSCNEINVDDTISGLSLAVYSLAFFIFLLALNTVTLFINLFKRK